MRDVVIVGGGPAGLYAAGALAGRGFDVAVLEEHASPGEPVHCTGVLAADAFDEFDLPRESLLNPLDTVRFFSPSADVVEYTTARTEAVVIDRRILDRALADRASASGAAVLAGRRVTDITVDTGSVTVRCRDQAPERGRIVILATGANYTLQRRLQLGLPSVFLQSAQLELPALRPGAVEVHFGAEVAPRGFAWAVPVRRPEGTFARVGVMASSRAGRHFDVMLARVARRWGIDPAHGAASPRRKVLPLAPIRRTFGHRVLAVGDAAGLVKATTGGGIYYAIVSAALAADTAARALSAGVADGAALRPYEVAWRRRLGPELQAQLSLRMLAHRLGDAEIEAFFELARTDGVMPIVRRTARFNQHRDLIVALMRHPPARRVLFRRLATGVGARMLTTTR